MADRKEQIWLGIDVGGTKTLAVAYDSKLKEMGRDRKKTKGLEGPDVSVERLIGAARCAIEKCARRPEDLAGIGIGSPGPLNLKKGVVLETPNLPWRNLPLRDIVQKEFSCPVELLNDVDAGVYGEYVLGAGRGGRCVFGIFPGTGIGGGCVYEGRILTGGSVSAFEIGHCRVLPKGPVCGCGRRGCLEAVASRLAIASAAAAAAYRGQAPNLLKAAGTDIDAIRSGVLAAAIEAGDKAVERIVRRAARWLGVGVSYAVNLLAPDIVILGGGLVQAMPKLYMAEATIGARKHVFPSFEGSYDMRVSELGDDATVSGAAAWVRSVVTGDEKKTS
jgi:glucokinase